MCGRGAARRSRHAWRTAHRSSVSSSLLSRHHLHRWLECQRQRGAARRSRHAWRTAHRSSVSSSLLSRHRPHRRLECQQELLAQAPASTPTNVFPGGTTASSRRHLRLFPCQGSRRTATSRPPRACDWPRQRARRRRQLQTTAACALSRRGVAIDRGWVQQLLGLMIMRVYFQ